MMVILGTLIQFLYSLIFTSFQYSRYLSSFSILRTYIGVSERILTSLLDTSLFAYFKLSNHKDGSRSIDARFR